jgi:hypothetical protein
MNTEMNNFMKIAKQIRDNLKFNLTRLDNEYIALVFKNKMNIQDDVKVIKGFDNYCITDKGTVYNMNTNQIVKSRIDGEYKRIGLYKNGIETKIRIHRLLAIHFIPNPYNLRCVDHINHDALNNDLSNLRWTTSSENNRNRTKKANTSSQYNGVSFNKKANKWLAHSTINYKTKHLGYFNNEIDAAKTFDKYARENNLYTTNFNFPE